MLECVVNISEGADRALVGAIGAAAGHDLLDVHADPDHNRAVLTLVGEEAPRRVARGLRGGRDGFGPTLEVVGIA